MKTTTLILLGLAAVIALPLLVAAFVKKEYAIYREITINRPKAEVFDYLRHLKNQDHYNKWVMRDPNMQKTYRGTDGTPGFVYGWNGNDQAGEGEQEITRISEGERIDVEIRFKRPMASIAQTPFVTEAVGANQTKVRWGMEGKQTYPLNLMNLFLDGMLGKDMDQSLNNLKTILEKQPVTQATR